MRASDSAGLDLAPQLLEAIRTFPRVRTIEHCGATISASPFDFYVECPQCGARIKVRSFGGATELEDVFDAVFEWLNDPQARAVAAHRQQVLAEDKDD
jgi:hypothetical protein